MESSLNKIIELSEKFRKASFNKAEILKQIEVEVKNLNLPFWGRLTYFNGQPRILAGKIEKIEVKGDCLLCTVGDYRSVNGNGTVDYKILHRDKKIPIENLKSGTIWQEGSWIPENIKALLKK